MPKFFFGTRSLQDFPRGCVLTIGAFDGVHLGHQAIISRLREQSAALGLPAIAVTFYPDPIQYFKPDQAPSQIMNLREKTISLLDAGVDAVACLPFNSEVRNMAAADFVEGFLLERLGAKYIIVGDDFRFGAGREGDFKLLESAGQKHGFVTERAETLEYNGERVSSTRLRKLLQNGELAAAETLFGRSYELCGRVIRGRQLGRELGFPTANIPLKRKQVPISGVFAVRAKVGDGWIDSVANIGYRPTVNHLDIPLLEVHLLDYQSDLYGQHLRVRFGKKLRDEKSFDSVESLTLAIQEDISQARKWFQEQSLPPE